MCYKSVKITQNTSFYIAIVTEGNTVSHPYAYEVVQGLINSGKFGFVYVTASDNGLGNAVIEKLNTEQKSKCEFHHLDTKNGDSIYNLVKCIVTDLY